MASAMAIRIPEVALSSGDGRAMPLVGMGTAAYPFAPENTKSAILAAVELGYRHFDTASLYRSEKPLGDAVIEAVRLGLIRSREEVFVTSKVWCHDCHPELVLPAIKKSLRNLQMDYLDLYLIHWPVSVKPGTSLLPIHREAVVPMDLKAVWEAMEECQRLGLAKAIGVSNFTRKKIEELLVNAKIPPAVNQVEMNPIWQQQKLREFCAEKGIVVTAYSPLGGQGNMAVMDCEVLKEIAKARGKTVAQVSLRWIYEQGVSIVVKSFKGERLKENLEIFDWELSNEEHLKISRIPQHKRISVLLILSPQGSLKSVDLSDIDNVEM
ncbi:non-functional NADPH-dependent codeinone reductase 2-like [Typha angustifolia]|uniref:non-functional NADPH-dependent codeinone reductase 2-like n=1 Tax=Typha angustifolia TaxID=59011 RepID=UPI003C30DFF4